MIKLVISATLMFVTTYTLCLFYSFLSVIYLIVKYLKYDPKFWIPKERKQPPACLSNPEFGNHNYIRANVSCANFLFNIKNLADIYSKLNQNLSWIMIVKAHVLKNPTFDLYRNIKKKIKHTGHVFIIELFYSIFVLFILRNVLLIFFSSNSNCIVKHFYFIDLFQLCSNGRTGNA